MTASPETLMDVAIVGGGAAGAYAAYRLTRPSARKSKIIKRLLQRTGRSKKDHLDVRLFEMSDRIGGRLWSVTVPGLPNIPAELGGPGFCQLQQSVYGLCETLGLDVERSAMYNGGSQFYYVRGHHITDKDFQPPQKYPFIRQLYYPHTIPYFLTETEKWKNPGELITETLTAGVVGYGEILAGLQEKFKKVLEEVVWKGKLLNEKQLSKIFKELYKLDLRCREAKMNPKMIFHDEATSASEHGFWNLLQEVLSSEAYQLIVSTTYGSSSYMNNNLYPVLVSVLSFLFSNPWWQLGNGYQALPEALVKRFTKKVGKDKVYLGTQLNRLEKRDDDTIRLYFEGEDGTAFHLDARYVILALPQRALQMLDRDSFIFNNDAFLSDLNTVTGAPVYKLFLSYDEPWWENVHLGPGIPPPGLGWSTTDLPLRGVYYIGSEEDGKSLLNASFSDAAATQFWAGYLPSSRYGETGAPFAVEDKPDSLELPLLDTNHEMVKMAQFLLKRMHNDPKIPDPKYAVYQDWAWDPYGGGWHNWNPFVKVWKVMPRIRRMSVSKDSNPRVFLCGEAYSIEHGWVEGALNTAEMVLEEYFGLPRPKWVNPNYDFGP